MAEQIHYTSMEPRATVERLRIHGRLFTGYALALADRAGLSATEAADLFVRPLLASAPPVNDAPNPEALRSWMKLEATAMEAVHGQVRLEQEGKEWRMVIAVADDLAWLRPWNVSNAYWEAWLEEHLKRVAARHGMAAIARLQDQELCLTFRPPS